MTRETKIGLLVGLAFIIVIGILLSDQFTRQTDVPPANITVVGDNVRNGAGLLHSETASGPSQAPAVTPDRQVLSRDELRSHTGGITRVSVGPRSGAPSTLLGTTRRPTDGGGDAGSGAVADDGSGGVTPGVSVDPGTRDSDVPTPPTPTAPRADDTHARGATVGAPRRQRDINLHPELADNDHQPDAAPPARSDEGSSQPDSPTPDAPEPETPRRSHKAPTDADPRLRAARDGGEELVKIGGDGARTPETDSDAGNDRTSEPTKPARHSTAVAGKSVQAQAGDSLSRLAARYMGANTEANRKAIIAANSSLQANPNLIIAGRTYVIPSPSAAPHAASDDANSNDDAPRVVKREPATDDTAPSDDRADARRERDTRSDTGADTASDDSKSTKPVATHIYVVKPGDSLYHIAQAELDDPDAVAAIKALNKSVLHDSDVVRPGMKLKLPS